MARTLQTPADKLLKVLDEDGRPLTVARLRQVLGVSDRTIHRRLQELVQLGTLQQVSRGTYSRGGDSVGLSEIAQRIVSAIKDVDADAHLTGFDVLAPYAHQFTYEYPHLVYCHPSHASGLARELSKQGFLVVPAGPHALLGPDPSQTVVLRRQPQADGLYPVRDNVAAPEKAWVDLLREVRRSRLPFDYGELGRILRGMELAGRDLGTLKAYARRAGYLHRVQAALGEVPPPSRDENQLATGYAA